MDSCAQGDVQTTLCMRHLGVAFDPGKVPHGSMVNEVRRLKP